MRASGDDPQRMMAWREHGHECWSLAVGCVHNLAVGKTHCMPLRRARFPSPGAMMMGDVNFSILYIVEAVTRPSDADCRA